MSSAESWISCIIETEYRRSNKEFLNIEVFYYLQCFFVSKAAYFNPKQALYKTKINNTIDPGQCKNPAQDLSLRLQNFKSIAMKKLKHFASRFFILLISIGSLISYNSCISDQKDKDLLSIQTFLERHDGTAWTVIEDDLRVYIRLNNDKDEDLELWISELELAKLMTKKECFYHNHEILNAAEVEVLEHSGSKLAFTYLEDESYTFTIDGERLKLEFENSDDVKKTIYFAKSTEDVDDLDICPEKRTPEPFEWRFLN